MHAYGRKAVFSAVKNYVSYKVCFIAKEKYAIDYIDAYKLNKSFNMLK